MSLLALPLTAFPVAAQEAEKAETLDNTLLEMCQHLEDENRRLNVSLQHALREAESAKKEATAAPLIRHYRMAIVRSRAESERLKDKLAEERELTHGLRLELERCMKDLGALAGELQGDHTHAGASSELALVDRDIEELKQLLKQKALMQTSELVKGVLE